MVGKWGSFSFKRNCTKWGVYIHSDVGLNKRGIVERMPTVIQINSKKYLSTPLLLTIIYLNIAPEDIFDVNSISLGNKTVKTRKFIGSQR